VITYHLSFIIRAVTLKLETGITDLGPVMFDLSQDQNSVPFQ